MADLLAHLRAATGRCGAARGLRLEASFESEFTAWHGDDTPLHEQPAYGLEATRAAGPFLLAIVRRLQALGVEVDQVHPEYSPGQLEVSVGRPGRSRRPTASCWCAT